YRESVLAALVAEGHQIIEVPLVQVESKDASVNNAANIQTLTSTITETSSLLDAITAVRDKNYQGECCAIANSEDLSENQYQVLQKRLVKTLVQRRAIRKYVLKQRYGIPVTAELVAKDDRDWYPKLLLHYYLTIGRDYLAQRDAEVARSLIKSGNGSIFQPDFNRSQLGAAVGILDILGLPVLLESEQRELKHTDEDLREMATLALANRASIKTALGIRIAANSTPITIVRRLLDKVGYGLQCTRRESKAKNRARVYQVVNPNDGRFEVFQYWLASENQRWDTLLSGMEGDSLEWNNLIISGNSNASEYVQLCLNL
ncbi:MAG TPA: bifunctional DNA primase/helicase, partial [Cyanophyceae cyanobacterium]